MKKRMYSPDLRAMSLLSGVTQPFVMGANNIIHLHDKVITIYS
jgi:hypothetical protein